MSDSIQLDYWRNPPRTGERGRWVTVSIRKHYDIPPVAPPLPGVEPDMFRIEPEHEKIEAEDTTSDVTFERLLSKITRGEPEVVAWAYPDVFIDILERLRIDYPVPDRMWWKDAAPYRERPAPNA